MVNWDVACSSEISNCGNLIVYNMLMVGPPGSGKSMLATRLAGILPALSPKELLEVSMVASISGQLPDGMLSDRRPFRAPHHSASMAALVGGGVKAKPGEATMAHNGVLFLDELPEFHPQVLDSLRQPLESGEIVIARANYRVKYPCRFQLIAAMNPCRCGMAGEPGHQCRRGERCVSDYQERISGPFLDRIDIRVEVPAVSAADIIAPSHCEASGDVSKRVMNARNIQQKRYCSVDLGQKTNAMVSGAIIEETAKIGSDAKQLMIEAANVMKFSARAYHRILKVARTIADLDGAEQVAKIHLAEAIAYRVSSKRFANAA